MMSPDEAYKRLEEFNKLEADWDSYGACPVAQTAASNAKKIIGNMPKNLVWIVPVPDGGIQLEYRLYPYEFEVGINADGTYGFLLIIHTKNEGKIYKELDDVTYADIVTLLHVFVEAI